MVTYLPNPYELCELNPLEDESYIIEALKVMTGKRFTCGDVMYSGHSVNMTIMNLAWQQYVPQHWRAAPVLRVCWWLANIGGLLTCVATHFHYSADVLLGFSISCC